MTLKRVMEVLRFTRLPLTNEKRLQEALSEAFDVVGIEHEREVTLSRGNVIDFMLPGGLGIECKIKGGKRDVYHQIERYAGHDQVRAIILATNVPMGFPKEINGKPMYLHNFAVAWL